MMGAISHQIPPIWRVDLAGLNVETVERRAARKNGADSAILVRVIAPGGRAAIFGMVTAVGMSKLVRRVPVCVRAVGVPGIAMAGSSRPGGTRSGDVRNVGGTASHVTEVFGHHAVIAPA